MDTAVRTKPGGRKASAPHGARCAGRTLSLALRPRRSSAPGCTRRGLRRRPGWPVAPRPELLLITAERAGGGAWRGADWARAPPRPAPPTPRDWLRTRKDRALAPRPRPPMGAPARPDRRTAFDQSGRKEARACGPGES
ncbi:DNA-binding protein inhibitor ID-2 isoform X1 [Nycticebus coucang]|uniref:DNA-binding protein inhibitor ID-2 isoform X1 n=1 Tax=Nycticebus coucang TaxID=9470 RepID=UPI00234CFE8A|nr:DNA-binding protein inhibitor ID-2 isoform X1 [Nycticebus coucang]